MYVNQDNFGYSYYECFSWWTTLLNLLRNSNPGPLTCRGSYKYNFEKKTAEHVFLEDRIGAQFEVSGLDGHLNSSIFEWLFTNKSCHIKKK